MAHITKSNPQGKGAYTKLTEEKIEQAARVLRLGSYAKSAADFVGIGQTAWYRYLREAEQLEKIPEEQWTSTDRLKIKFAKTVTQARAEGEIRNMQIIANAAPTNWQAAAWVLERTHPEKFSLLHRISVRSENEQQLAPLNADEIRQQIAQRKEVEVAKKAEEAENEG